MAKHPIAPALQVGQMKRKRERSWLSGPTGCFHQAVPALQWQAAGSRQPSLQINRLLSCSLFPSHLLLVHSSAQHSLWQKRSWLSPPVLLKVSQVCSSVCLFRATQRDVMGHYLDPQEGWKTRRASASAGDENDHRFSYDAYNEGCHSDTRGVRTQVKAGKIQIQNTHCAGLNPIGK